MFDIGFSELLLIGVVALIVIGPERLPKVARTAGLLVGRIQRYIANVKADISQEIQLEELHRAGETLRDTVQATGKSMSAEVAELRNSMKNPESKPALSGESEPELAADEGLQTELALEPPQPANPHQPATQPQSQSSS